MKLALLYSTKEEIPTEYTSLYEEVDGKWKLTAIDGIKTQEDVEKVMQAKQHEVDNRKRIEAELAELKQKFDGINPDEVRKMLEENANAKLKKQNPDIDLDKVKLQKDLEKTLEELSSAREQIAGFQQEKKQSTIKDSLLKVARELNFDPKFDDDVILRSSQFQVSEAGDVLTVDGKNPVDFLKPLAEKFSLPSQGSGARTPGGKMPTNNDQSKAYQEAKQKGDIQGMMLHAPPVQPKG